MLKVRLIPVLLLKNNRMVKPIRFGEGGERDVGWPLTTAKIYDAQGADELVFLDINTGDADRSFLFRTLREVTENCFVPVTAGGGIRTLNDVHKILRAGADKVCINTLAIDEPDLIRRAADRFGRQCIVISIDVKKSMQGRYEVFTHGGKKATDIEVCDAAKRAEAFGAGEILLTSIDREGTMIGYDIELIRMVADSVSIPVIAHGGAGIRQHFVDAVLAGHAHAIAASSIFHFADANLIQVKSFMHNAGIAMRLTLL